MNTRGKRKMKRRSPIRHKVNRYTRQNGTYVREYNRGLRNPTQRRRIVVGTLENRGNEFPYEQIEEGMRPVVESLHELDIETIGACEGHLEDSEWEPAYVGLRVTPKQVSEVESDLSELISSGDISLVELPPYQVLPHETEEEARKYIDPMYERGERKYTLIVLPGMKGSETEHREETDEVVEELVSDLK